MPDEARASRLEPRLSAFDTAMVVVSLVIGTGIFRTPAMVAGATGETAPFLIAWGIGGVTSLVGALCFAEIGSRFPRAGGYYKVVAHCYHPMTAFLLNWAQILMQGAGSAGVALIGAEYLLRVAGPQAAGRRAATLVAAALVGGLILLNAAGIRAGSRAQNVLSGLKIVLIAGLAIVGLAFVPGPGEAAPAPMPAPSAAAGGMLAALVAVFYAYGGYQNTMNLAGDVRDARRRLPLGICGGMAIVTLLYLGLNAAYVMVLGPGGVAGSPLVAAELSRALMGGAGETFVSVAIFISAAGFVNATILHVPRSYVAMADDGLLPPALGRLNPATGAQPGGLAFFAATSLLPLFFLGSFEKLLGYVMFTDEITLAIVASSIFVLRRRGEGKAGEIFRMPGYPWLPAAYVLVVLAIAAEILVHQTSLALAGVAVAAAGLPIYFLLRSRW